MSITSLFKPFVNQIIVILILNGDNIVAACVVVLYTNNSVNERWFSTKQLLRVKDIYRKKKNKSNEATIIIDFRPKK